MEGLQVVGAVWAVSFLIAGLMSWSNIEPKKIIRGLFWLLLGCWFYWLALLSVLAVLFPADQCQ